MSIAGVVAWVGGAASVLAFFAKFDDLANEKTKGDMTAALRRNPARSAAVKWPEIFNRLFCRVYGSDLLSWRFVAMSLATTLIVVLALFVMVLVKERPAFLWQARGLEHLGDLDPAALLELLKLVLIYSAPLDFLGMLKSRLILAAIRSGNAIPLLLADFLLSLALSLGGYILLLRFGGGETDLLGILQEYPGDMMNIETWSPLIWSTLTTSLWVVTFYVSMIVIRSSSTLLHLITRFLDIEKKPFSALGLVAAGLISLVSLINVSVRHL